MRKKASRLTLLSAILLLPAAFMIQGCMNPFPSIMKPPPGGDNSPSVPSSLPAPPTGGGGGGASSPDSGGGGSDSGGGGGDDGSLPMPSIPGGGLPVPGGNMPSTPGMPGGGDSSGGDGDDDGGWETSNELPNPLKIPGQGSGRDEGGEGSGDCGAGTDPLSGSRPGEEGSQDCTDGETSGASGEDSGSGSSDDPMEDALGDLDGGILDKRNEARDRDNSDASDQDVPGANDDGLEPATGAPMGDETNESNENAPLPAPSSEGIATPKSVPDARDDDIIARQLREAAEAETDPELKQKLWEEYERYKSRR